MRLKLTILMFCCLLGFTSTSVEAEDNEVLDFKSFQKVMIQQLGLLNKNLKQERNEDFALKKFDELKTLIDSVKEGEPVDIETMKRIQISGAFLHPYSRKAMREIIKAAESYQSTVEVTEEEGAGESDEPAEGEAEAPPKQVLYFGVDTHLNNVHRIVMRHARSVRIFPQTTTQEKNEMLRAATVIMLEELEAYFLNNNGIQFKIDYSQGVPEDSYLTPIYNSRKNFDVIPWRQVLVQSNDTRYFGVRESKVIRGSFYVRDFSNSIYLHYDEIRRKVIAKAGKSDHSVLIFKLNHTTDMDEPKRAHDEIRRILKLVHYQALKYMREPETVRRETKKTKMNEDEIARVIFDSNGFLDHYLKLRFRFEDPMLVEIVKVTASDLEGYQYKIQVKRPAVSIMDKFSVRYRLEYYTNADVKDLGNGTKLESELKVIQWPEIITKRQGRNKWYYEIPATSPFQLELDVKKIIKP